MKRIIYAVMLVCIVTGLTLSCSTVKNEDIDKEVEAFLRQLSKDFKGPDSILFSHFQTSQNWDAMLKAIHVMQNKDLEFMDCSLIFDDINITKEDEGIRVVARFAFNTKDIQDARQDITNVPLWLTKRDGKFVIQKMDAEEFYRDYLSFFKSISNEVQNEKGMARRKGYYQKALELQKNYDSVIWFTEYHDMRYYYVVNGKWENYFMGRKSRPLNYTMGLVDETGKEIVPVSYDLIGTPNMVAPDLLEVKKDDRYGYVQLTTGKVVVPAAYTWIVPYTGQNIFALAKKDSIFGWLDASYEFHGGYPDQETELFIKTFSFLPRHMILDDEHQVFSEITSVLYAGVGIVVPPSYLTYFGIFDEVEDSFTGEVDNESAETFSKEADVSSLANIIEGLTAVITRTKDSYVYGRESFYSKNKITFVDDHADSVVTVPRLGAGDLSFRKVDSTLLEIKMTLTEEQIDNAEYMDDQSEWNVPEYAYFRMLSGKSLEPLISKRTFKFTEFVMMDSTYIKGRFVYMPYNESKKLYRDVLSTKTLTRMRNEILAVYGYSFEDQETQDEFKYRKWYAARHHAYADFMDDMGAVDKHNLLFLEKMVGTLDPSYVAAL